MVLSNLEPNGRVRARCQLGEGRNEAHGDIAHCFPVVHGRWTETRRPRYDFLLDTGREESDPLLPPLVTFYRGHLGLARTPMVFPVPKLTG